MSLERLDDAQLARRSIKKDQAAFAVLVSRHGKTVRGITARLTRGGSEADDIAQSAFLTAWRRIETYAGGSFKSWIGTIAYREFLQYRRKQKFDLPYEEEVHGDVNNASHYNYGNRLDLDMALQRLSEKQRICVTLCVAAGFTHAEAAKATGWPLGTVKSHVNRGVASLRKALAVDNVA